MNIALIEKIITLLQLLLQLLIRKENERDLAKNTANPEDNEKIERLLNSI